MEGILRTLKKIDMGESLSQEEKLNASLLMNRGYVELEPIGPGFGDSKMRLSEKSHKFRSLF